MIRFMKETYKNAFSKRLVQNKVLKSQNKRIIGLGGPDILDYVNILRSKGFEDITIYEKDPSVYAKQLEDKPDCKLIFGNILENLKENAFYDLDFCASINSVEPYLHKILRIKEFVLTVSIRPIGLVETICTFNNYGGDSEFVQYTDTSPMLVFFNNKTH